MKGYECVIGLFGDASTGFVFPVVGGWDRHVIREVNGIPSNCSRKTKK